MTQHFVQMPLFGEPVGSSPKNDNLSPENDNSSTLLGDQVRALLKCKKVKYTRDQAKVLAAGFGLILYIREKKEIHKTCQNPMLGWYLVRVHKTYAEAERTLKAERKGFIETRENGSIVLCAALSAAGFEFYRSEGIMKGHGTPRIKIWPGWRTWKKFETGRECKAAWDGLMKTDMKALEG